MTFLRNCWYIAAWSEDVFTQPIGRRILNEHILIYRRKDGVAVAMSDRCPHRFAPLHMGKVMPGDRIQCPYHGLQFDTTGACVFNPQGSGATPAAVHLRTYPLIEQYGALWIWMGEADRADEAALPAFPFLADAALGRVQGYLHLNAHYELMSDNILDLSHVDFLHPGSLGCEATSRVKPVMRQEGNRVYCERWMPDAYQGPLTSMLFEREGQKVDAWIDVIWDAPALMQLHFGMVEVGGKREGGPQTLNVHFMTPETDSSTHYFWASCRNFRLHEPGLENVLHASTEGAFVTEDKPMIEAQQMMMAGADFWSLKPALLQGDAAGVMARRTLARLIAEEQAAQTAR